MIPEDKYVKVQKQLMMMPPDQMVAKCPVAAQVGLTHQPFCMMGDEKTERFNDMLKV